MISGSWLTIEPFINFHWYKFAVHKLADTFPTIVNLYQMHHLSVVNGTEFQRLNAMLPYSIFNVTDQR